MPSCEYLASIGGLYRNKGTDGAGESYSGITAVLPRVDDVRMIWWVDNEIVSGVGELDRYSLVVRWGEKYPAVYSSPEDGVLSGEWDDGAGAKRSNCSPRSNPSRRRCRRAGTSWKG